MRLMRIFCGALFSLGAGCGLADYESRMDEQRERLRAHDEQSKYLGTALEPPGAADKDSLPPIPFVISLNLPKGISSSVAPKDGLFLVDKQLIARYPGTEGYNVYVCGALAASTDEAKDEKRTAWTPAEFQDGFRLALGTIVNRYFKAPQAVERVVRPTGWKPGRKALEKGRDIAFDFYVLEDKPGDPDTMHLDVYVHQEGSRLLALAFQIPPARARIVPFSKASTHACARWRWAVLQRLAPGKLRPSTTNRPRSGAIAPVPPP